MNRLIFTCLLIKVLFVLTSATCPEGMISSISDKTTCFLLVPQKQPFLIAENLCIQKNGHLTSIHDAFENAFIREEAQQIFTDSTNSGFWIGFNDLNMKGNWSWTDGSPYDYSDWDKGQTNNNPGYNCGSLKLQGGLWISEDCDTPKPFVCRIKMSNVPTTSKPLPCPVSYTYNSNTGACYKAYKQWINWTSAENFCFSDGGAHLASIHSLEENAFVANLIPFDPNNHECNGYSWAWIGLFSVTKQESWEWTDNSPFNFSAWAYGRPIDPTQLFCGVLWNGPTCGAALETWADGLCKITNGYFVCKKPAT